MNWVYSIGATKLAGASLYAFIIANCPIPPAIPIPHKNRKSIKFGGVQPNGRNAAEPSVQESVK